MSDVTPTPPAVPPPNWLSRLFTAILPQFIAYSRKGMIWFSTLGAGGILELVKTMGNAQGWTPDQMSTWNGRLMFLQGLVLLIGKFWTDQIAAEDAALKTGLPPPQPAPVTVITAAPPAPHVPLVQGLPPLGGDRK